MDYDGDDITAAIGLLAETKRFMFENSIQCEETVYQSDRVIVNAYDFIARLCEIVGYPEEESDE